MIAALPAEEKLLRPEQPFGATKHNLADKWKRLGCCSTFETQPVGYIRQIRELTRGKIIEIVQTIIYDKERKNETKNI